MEPIQGTGSRSWRYKGSQVEGGSKETCIVTRATTALDEVRAALHSEACEIAPNHDPTIRWR
jgi:hypothetical protein